MYKRAKTWLFIFPSVLLAVSCAQKPTSPTAELRRSCPPMVHLKTVKTLGCFVYSNHLLAVGNPSAVPIPEGTLISFAAKLENAGAYCATVPAPQSIPPHLFITITGQPVFDSKAPCQAWREVTPVVNQ